MNELIQNIKNLAEVYSTNLKGKIEARTEEMKTDDNSHYLIYRVLGITLQEGQLIDQYQNTGRFLYKYAGSFLEEAATLCLNYKFPDGIKTKVENTIGQRPKTFEIDFLNANDAVSYTHLDVYKRQQQLCISFFNNYLTKSLICYKLAISNLPQQTQNLYTDFCTCLKTNQNPKKEQSLSLCFV